MVQVRVAWYGKSVCVTEDGWHYTRCVVCGTELHDLVSQREGADAGCRRQFPSSDIARLGDAARASDRRRFHDEVLELGFVVE